jgi:ribosome biogenesis GTPase
MTEYTLSDLGWSAHYLSQLDLSELDLTPLRIAEVHRTRLVGVGAGGVRELPPDGSVAVGDWVLTDAARIVRRLDRRSFLSRRAAGTGAETQAIAANVDTLMVVTSCNSDFNPARIERYLALAAEAGCDPAVVLTKADLAAPDRYVAAAEALSRDLPVVALDATSPDTPGRLADWCRRGQTIALVGSSGTGKTTLTNALTGEAGRTAGIREDDAKGRHTTTSRALRPMLGGGWIIDTPGMRALRLADAAEGIDAVFDDVTGLAEGCRFRDCTHDAEPGCAVRAAIDVGDLAADRLERWRKLRREDRYNSETLAEARARDKEFGKMVRGVKRERDLRRRD